jgi:hypothetical protein
VRSGAAAIGTYTDRPAAPGVEIRAIPSEQELVVYFYELHEGDEDVFSDLILARETEMEPDVFFDIVQTVRRRVQDTFETDTLIEAIAEELEREYDFIAITDERLHAAINVSPVEAENFLADLDADEDDAEDDEDEDEEDARAGADDGEFRSLYVDIESNPNVRPN